MGVKTCLFFSLLFLSASMFYLSSCGINEPNLLDDEQEKFNAHLANECIEPENIVFEYYFQIRIVQSEVRSDNVSQFFAANNCEIPKLNFTGQYVYVALENTDRLLASHIFDTQSFGLSIFEQLNTSLDALNFRDCPVSWQIKCKYPIVKIYPDTEYDFGDFVDSGYAFRPGDSIAIEIKQDYRTAQFGELVNIVELEGCNSRMLSSPTWRFLPSYSSDLSRVLIECGIWYQNGVVYDFSNLSRTDQTNYSATELEGGGIVNPHTDGEYMWAQTDGRHGFNGEYNSCYVDFMKNSGAAEANGQLAKRFEYSYEDLEIDECRDYDVQGMSHTDEFFVLSVDRNRNTDGQYVVNFDTGEEVRISSRGYGLIGSWLPNSNNFVFLSVEQSTLRLYDAETGQSTDIMPISEIESIMPGNVRNIYIDTAEYFGPHSVSLLTTRDANVNGGVAYSYARLDFNDDFSSYQVYQSEHLNDVVGVSCGTSANLGLPSLRLTTGNPNGPYTLNGCSTDVLIGTPDTNEVYGTFITTFSKVSIQTNLTAEYSECSDIRYPFKNDFDDDGRPDLCDFDIDDDGVPIWFDLCDDTQSQSEFDLIGDGCFRNEFWGDLDSDGVTASGDDCPRGFENWSTDRWVGPKPYDYDSDGCHDLVEDLDDDNDDIPDEIDHCPLRENGHIDLDDDGLCEGDDLDDDGDGFTDQDEEDCGSNSTDFYSKPLDTDFDTICDDIDDDMDGDNFTNELDAFPLDGSEWNDLDEDGIGNNSDDCVGTYGTSTVDRLGCLDQDGDGVSDLNDLDPYDAEIGLDEYDGPRLDIVEENETNLSTNQIDIASESDGVVVYSTIGVLCIAGIIIFVRSRTSSPDDEEEEFGEADEFYRNVTTTPVASSDEPSIQSTPDFSLSGSQHESGYEVLEYPEDSESWWWKDEENQCWVPWE